MDDKVYEYKYIGRADKRTGVYEIHYHGPKYEREDIVVGCYGIDNFNKKVADYKKMGFELNSKPRVKATHHHKFGDREYVSATMFRWVPKDSEEQKAKREEIARQREAEAKAAKFGSYVIDLLNRL